MVRNERYPNTERYPSEHLMCQAPRRRGKGMIGGRSIENRSISRYRDLFLKIFLLIIKSNRGHVRQPPSRCGRHATLTLTYAPDSVAPCANECGKIVSPARISYAVHICSDKIYISMSVSDPMWADTHKYCLWLRCERAEVRSQRSLALEQYKNARYT